MKKTIISIIAVISIIATVFSIGSLAVDFEPYVVDSNFQVIIPYNTTFNSDDYGTYYFRYTNSSMAGTCTNLRVDGAKSLWLYNGSQTKKLTSNEAITLTILSGQTLSETVVTFLDTYTTWDAPIPPPAPMETALDNTNAMFGTTLSVMTVIITWLLANQIALCGLYLYILIACIGIGKRFVKT